MEYTTLNNGVRMPLLGYGTWEVRGEEGCRCVRQALEVGYRLLDTARMYGNEEMVGRAVRQSGLPREEIFLTTKLYRPSASYEKAWQGVEDSLRALGVDYIDLMLIHEPYPEAPAMYRALEEAYDAGKIRAIGVSNFDQAALERLLACCRVTPAVDQIESHVYHPRRELQRWLAARGIRMQSWAPFTEGRRDIFAQPELVQIGAAHRKTAAQAALRYLVQNGIGVIPKTVHRQRMEENFAIFDFTLTEQEMERIRALDGGQSLFGWY